MNPVLTTDADGLKGLLRSGYGGRHLTSVYTEKTDSVIREIFASANSYSGICLMAVGGYGRGELAPFSDVDIMLFVKDRSVSETARGLLYKLWSTKLNISYSFRTPADCISEANKDIRTKTALLEHRFIAGDMDLYDYFRNSVYPQIAYRNQKRFVAEKLRDVEARHKKFGGSVFLLEPNIKEGKGGLRDVHASLWLASVKRKIRHFDDLKQMLPPYDFQRLERAYDFMLKVRFCLHAASGRSNDVLSFEFHDLTAELLNFKGSGRFFAAERFMRYLHLKASVIANTASYVFDACSLPFVQVPVYFTRKKAAEDFSVSKDRIVFTGSALLDADKIMEAFYIMSKTGKRFSRGLKEEIRKNLYRIDRRARSSARAAGFLMDILSGSMIYETLREMHACGVLGRFIPEFGALSFLVVYEPHHRYTVDEHSLNAVKKLEELGATRYRNLEHLSGIIRKIKSREALFLSLLLHDIGKSGITRHNRPGYGAGHHGEAGYMGLKNISERLNLHIELRNRIEFLVRNHTLMSSVAFKRDPEDPDVIAQFADEVADRDNLDALYLLTYADMAAVGPDFWSEWKSLQLRELYETALIRIAGAPRRDSELMGSIPAIPESEREKLRQFLSVMPERYKLSTPYNKIYRDFELSLNAVEKKPAIEINEGPGGTAEVTIAAWDRPGLFSDIVGAFSSMGMNIFNARAYTAANGLVIDRVRVSNWKELLWSGTAQLLEKNLAEAVDAGNTKTVRTKGGEQAFQKTSGTHDRFGSFVELDNETSSESTIVEFFAADRLGLLYDVSGIMNEKGVDIISARINTETGLAHDIFYIQQAGGKINGTAAVGLLLKLWESLR